MFLSTSLISSDIFTYFKEVPPFLDETMHSYFDKFIYKYSCQNKLINQALHKVLENSEKISKIQE